MSFYFYYFLLFSKSVFTIVSQSLTFITYTILYYGYKQKKKIKNVGSYI